eukprot:Amastigsp_a842106_57.p2 type:complete len:327 gc:universal Amastigsp_a842106_57:230-1210(+)
MIGTRGDDGADGSEQRRWWRRLHSRRVGRGGSAEVLQPDHAEGDDGCDKGERKNNVHAGKRLQVELLLRELLRRDELALEPLVAQIRQEIVLVHLEHDGVDLRRELEIFVVNDAVHLGGHALTKHGESLIERSRVEEKLQHGAVIEHPHDFGRLHGFPRGIKSRELDHISHHVLLSPELAGRPLHNPDFDPRLVEIRDALDLRLELLLEQNRHQIRSVGRDVNDAERRPSHRVHPRRKAFDVKCLGERERPPRIPDSLIHARKVRARKPPWLHVPFKEPKDMAGEVHQRRARDPNPPVERREDEQQRRAGRHTLVHEISSGLKVRG